MQPPIGPPPDRDRPESAVPPPADPTGYGPAAPYGPPAYRPRAMPGEPRGTAPSGAGQWPADPYGADPYGVDQNALTDQYRRPPPSERTRYLPPADGRTAWIAAGRTSHLPPYAGPSAPSAPSVPAGPAADTTAQLGPNDRAAGPRKLTVTRVAAFRSREIDHPRACRSSTPQPPPTAPTGPG